MMYYYWKTKGILPSVFQKLPKGEWVVLRAFFETEVEEENKKREHYAKQGINCPCMFR